MRFRNIFKKWWKYFNWLKKEVIRRIDKILIREMSRNRIRWYFRSITITIYVNTSKISSNSISTHFSY